MLYAGTRFHHTGRGIRQADDWMGATVPYYQSCPGSELDKGPLRVASRTDSNCVALVISDWGTVKQTARPPLNSSASRLDDAIGSLFRLRRGA